MQINKADAQTLINNHKKYLIKELDSALQYDQLPSIFTIDSKQISKNQAINNYLKNLYTEKENKSNPDASWYPAVTGVKILNPLSDSKRGKVSYLELTDNIGNKHTIRIPNLRKNNHQLKFNYEYPPNVDNLPSCIPVIDSIPQEELTMDMNQLQDWRMLPYLTTDGWGEDFKFTMSFFLTNHKDFICKYLPSLESGNYWLQYKNDLCRKSICQSYHNENKLSERQKESRNLFLTSNPNTRIIFRKLNAIDQLEKKLEILNLDNRDQLQLFQIDIENARKTLKEHRNKNWDYFLNALSLIIFPIGMMRAGWCRFFHKTWDFTCTRSEIVLDKMKIT